MSSISPDQLTLLGKLPSEGDFVRIGNTDANAAALHGWLQSAVEQSAGRIPSHTVHFVCRFQGADCTTVGSMFPSHDRVGREFPLVLLSPLDGALDELPFSYWPALSEGFLAASDRVLEAAARQTIAELQQALLSVDPPHAANAPAAWGACEEALRTESPATFSQRVFADKGGSEQMYYAAQTLVTACEEATQGHTVHGRSSVTLDCPTRSPLDRFVWLHLLHRKLGSAAHPPAIFWTATDDRLLIALGVPPTALLGFLNEPSSGASSLWPLWTDRAQALEAAKNATPPAAIDAWTQGPNMDSAVTALV